MKSWTAKRTGEEKPDPAPLDPNTKSPLREAPGWLCLFVESSTGKPIRKAQPGGVSSPQVMSNTKHQLRNHQYRPNEVVAVPPTATDVPARIIAAHGHGRPAHPGASVIAHVQPRDDGGFFSKSRYRHIRIGVMKKDDTHLPEPKLSVIPGVPLTGYWSKKEYANLYLTWNMQAHVYGVPFALA